MIETKDIQVQERITKKGEQIAYIRNHSKNPFQMIIEKLRGQTRIVGLGEVHRQLKMEEFADSIINRAAKKKLINFLALEIGIDKQPDLETFMRTGKVDNNLEEILNHHKKGYRKILETARKRNLSVICVADNVNARDDFMKRKILNYLEIHPNEKGIFYAGNGHIVKRDNFTGEENLLSSELGGSYCAIIQIQEQSFPKPEMYDSTFGTVIAKPVGIDNVAKTPLRDATFDFHDGWLSEYGKLTDSIVFLPPLKFEEMT